MLIITSVFYLLLAVFYIYQYHSFVSFLEDSYTKHVATIRTNAAAAAKELSANLIAPERIKVAIGGAISSRDPLSDMPPIVFLPQFCQTASSGFDYHFYLSVDPSDVFFHNDDNVSNLTKHFNSTVAIHCHSNIRVTLHVIEGKYPMKLDSASVALDEAYLDDMDYLCSLFTLQTKHNWTSLNIHRLDAQNPLKLGVVDKGFVHRRYMDIIGSYSILERRPHNGSEYRGIINR